MAGGVPPLNKMRSSIGIALLQAWILTFMVGQTSSLRNFYRFFHPGRKNRNLQRLLKWEILCFPIIISQQFQWKYWYVFGLCIDTVLLAFILSFIDVSVNRWSPNIADIHTCMAKEKQMHICVWLKKSRYTYLYDHGKADIQTLIIYKVMKHRKILIKNNAYF